MPGFRVRDRTVLGILGVLAACMIAFPLLRVPFPHALIPEYYLFRYKSRALPHLAPVSLGLLVLIPAIAYACARLSRRLLIVSVLYLGAVLLQFAMPVLGEHGLNTHAYVFGSFSGHKEFARFAAVQPSVRRTVFDYDREVESGGLTEFGRSKPPGTAIFYVLSANAADALLLDASDPERRLQASSMFAALVWPFIAALVVVPAFLFGDAFFSRRTAFLGTLLLVTSPAFLLVILHLDQVLFPTLYTTTLLLGACGILRGRAAAGSLAGVVGFLGVYMSFGLCAAILAVLAIALLAAIGRLRAREGVGRSETIAFAAFCATGALLYAIFHFALKFDFPAEYGRAMAWHTAWKDWQSGPRETVVWAARNVLEFAWWMGPAALVGCVIAVAGSLVAVVRARPGDRDVIVTAVFVTWFVVALFGRNKSEVARLWLFFMPALCIAAASYWNGLLDRRASGGESAAGERLFVLSATGLATLNIAITIVYKANCNFW